MLLGVGIKGGTFFSTTEEQFLATDGPYLDRVWKKTIIDRKGGIRRWPII